MKFGRGGKEPERSPTPEEELAEALGVDLESVEGTGEDGSVTIPDVLDAGMPAGDDATTSASDEAPPPDAADSDRAAEASHADRNGADDDGSGDDGDGGGDVGWDDEGEDGDDRDRARTDDSRWTPQLSGYADWLERARAGALAEVVRGYAERVADVQEGRLPPSAAAVPTGIDSALVGKTLASGGPRRLLESFTEIVRNVLIFTPVLIAWLKISGGGIEGLDDMRGTALSIAILIIALIGVHVLLGLLRRQTTARAERIAQDFSAALTLASMETPPQQVETPEEIIDAFIRVVRELAANLRDAGQSLAGTQDVMTRMANQMADLVEKQDRQVETQARQMEELLTHLRAISRLGDQLGGLQRELSSAASTMNVTARTLSAIDKNLAPTAKRLGETVTKLDELARQLGGAVRQLERMAEGFAGGGVSMERSAKDFEEAVKQLNLVATRMLNELPSPDGTPPDGSGRR